MSNLTLILLAVGIVVAAVVLLSLNDIYEKRRRKRREEFGRENGFKPVPNEHVLKSSFRFPKEIMLYSVDLPSFENPLQGKRGDTVVLLVDYHYSEWVGDRTFRRNFTLCHFTSGDLALPVFELSPESVGDRVAGIFGYQDIDLQHSPVFSKKYLVRGKDEAAIRNLFTPAITGPLTSMNDVQVQGHEDVLVFTRSGGFVEEPDLPRMLQEAETVFDLLRRHPG